MRLLINSVRLSSSVSVSIDLISKSIFFSCQTSTSRSLVISVKLLNPSPIHSRLEEKFAFNSGDVCWRLVLGDLALDTSETLLEFAVDSYENFTQEK